MGAGEVGGEMLAALMPGVDWAPVAESARRAEREGTLESWIEAGATEVTVSDPPVSAGHRHPARHPRHLFHAVDLGAGALPTARRTVRSS
jgi:hypothetical protein